jgi:hypothetical protein
VKKRLYKPIKMATRTLDREFESHWSIDICLGFCVLYYAIYSKSASVWVLILDVGIDFQNKWIEVYGNFP